MRVAETRQEIIYFNNLLRVNKTTEILKDLHVRRFYYKITLDFY